MQKKYRLCRREDFSKVYRGGKSIANHQFVLYFKKNIETVHFRVGISASKKVGGAVERNRIRRQVKEIFRSQANSIIPGFDLVVIVRKPAMTLSYDALVKSIRHLLRKANLLDKSRVKETITH